MAQFHSNNPLQRRYLNEYTPETFQHAQPFSNAVSITAASGYYNTTLSGSTDEGSVDFNLTLRVSHRPSKVVSAKLFCIDDLSSVTVSMTIPVCDINHQSTGLHPTAHTALVELTKSGKNFSSYIPIIYNINGGGSSDSIRIPWTFEIYDESYLYSIMLTCFDITVGGYVDNESLPSQDLEEGTSAAALLYAVSGEAETVDFRVHKDGTLFE